MSNNKPKRNYHLTTRLGQFIYLSISNFTTNNLWESASACSFGFVFSFIPITLIIIVSLVTILQNFPGVLNSVLQFVTQFEDIIDVKPYIKNIAAYRSLHVVDIFLAIWIIWMARKLFSSIIYAMNKIFRSESKRQNFFNQILTILSEFVLVFIIVTVILSAFTLNKIISLPFLSFIINLFPKVLSHGSNLFMTWVVNVMLFLATFYAYRWLSGTAPKFGVCSFYSILSTACYFAVSILLNKFLNIKNYNIIYGTISTLVLLMLKVYFFFVIFLAGAQMVYVSQFFDTLLKTEIYLLPKHNKSMLTKFRRFLFINPSVLKDSYERLEVQAGDVIFDVGDDSNCVYYLCSGKILLRTNENSKTFVQGDFLGESQCLMEEKRISKATAITACELLVFTANDFHLLLNQSPAASKKALHKMTKFYKSNFSNN